MNLLIGTYSKSASGSCRNSVNRLISVILLSSLLGFLIAGIASLHFHVAPGGSIQVHSHPLPAGDSSSSKGGHSHSQAEFVFWSVFKHILEKLIVSAFFILLFYLVFISRRDNYQTAIYSKHQNCDLFERPPPSPLFA